MIENKAFTADKMRASRDILLNNLKACNPELKKLMFITSRVERNNWNGEKKQMLMSVRNKKFGIRLKINQRLKKLKAIKELVKCGELPESALAEYKENLRQ